MAYTALYRKFRPIRFDEIVGQEAITKTLKNQIIAGRVGHAYLFNGCRGTGKTSAAKILARAVNCLNPEDGEPCNKCENCRAALDGSLTDIVEMDAASNNSVEDIRSIKDEVNFLPTVAKYRVYIIDEVHMLSTGAFNALLKTLEEPPEHVKFILATTEPQKLLATILSRCQRFDFKKISVENIVKRLDFVCKDSKINSDEKALQIIATLADGAMRDALSILERCLQDGENVITEEKVKDLVGIPKLIYVENLAKALTEKNVKDVLINLKNVSDAGKDQEVFIWELIKYLKDVLLFKTANETGIYSDSEITNMKNIFENVNNDEIVDLIYSLSALQNDVKWAENKNIMIQAKLISICSDLNSQNYMKENHMKENLGKNAPNNLSQSEYTNLNERSGNYNSNLNNAYAYNQNNFQNLNIRIANLENNFKKLIEKIANNSNNSNNLYVNGRGQNTRTEVDKGNSNIKSESDTNAESNTKNEQSIKAQKNELKKSQNENVEGKNSNSLKDLEKKNTLENTKIDENYNQDASLSKCDNSKLKSGEYWGEILQKFKDEKKMLIYMNLMNTNVNEKNDMIVEIVFPQGINPGAKAILEKPENMSEISKEISLVYGKPMKVQLIDGRKKQEETLTEIDELTNSINFPIDIIDE